MRCSAVGTVSMVVMRIALAQAFVIAEREPFVFQDRPAGIAAELVALEGRQRHGRCDC